MNDILDDNYYGNYGLNLSNGNSSFEDEQYDQILTNESLSSFITDSPFSFRNPIFFSVPRDNNMKQVAPVVSKRQLFGAEEPKTEKQQNSLLKEEEK